MDELEISKVMSFLNNHIDSSVSLSDSEKADLALIDMDKNNSAIAYLCQKYNFPSQPIILLSNFPKKYQNVKCVKKPYLSKRLTTAVNEVCAQLMFQDVSGESLRITQWVGVDSGQSIEELLPNSALSEQLNTSLKAQIYKSDHLQHNHSSFANFETLNKENTDSKLTDLFEVQDEIDRITEKLQNEIAHISQLDLKIQDIRIPNSKLNRRSNQSKISVRNSSDYSFLDYLPKYGSVVINAGILFTLIFIYTEMINTRSSFSGEIQPVEKQPLAALFKEQPKIEIQLTRWPFTERHDAGDDSLPKSEIPATYDQTSSERQIRVEDLAINNLPVNNVNDALAETDANSQPFESRSIANGNDKSAVQPDFSADPFEPAEELEYFPADYSDAAYLSQNENVESSEYFTETSAFDRIQSENKLPEIQTNVHVYSENPDERFVVLNMIKYQSGQQIQEGPLLEEITPSGAVLRYQGQNFIVKKP